MCIYKIYDMIISHRIFHLVSICIYVSIYIYIYTLHVHIYIYIYANECNGSRGRTWAAAHARPPPAGKTYEAGERGVRELG